MTRIIPTVMIKNEARFIEDVLRPLVAVFGTVLVGDTGSTDGSDWVAERVGAVVLRYGPQNAWGLTQTRHNLGLEAKKLGADWQIQCDGDELYCKRALEHIRDFPIPEGRKAGFTSMLTLDEEENGTIWELDDVFCRCCVLPSDVRWTGEYPFDAPVVYGDPRNFFYYDLPEGIRYHAVHLHRLWRSAQDKDVWLRGEKQKQFAMVDGTRPRTIKFDLESWLKQ